MDAIAGIALLSAGVAVLAIGACVLLRRENAELREGLTAAVNALGESNHDLWRLRGELASVKARNDILERLNRWHGGAR